MKHVLLLLGFSTIVATVLPIIRAEAWWIRIFDFPRVQIASIALCILVAGFLVLNRHKVLHDLFLGLLVATIAYQAYMMYPYTSLAERQVLDAAKDHPPSRLSMLIANVLMTNRKSGELLEIIRGTNPDIVLTCETDAWWEEQLRVIETEYPFNLKQPLGNTYGMLLHSRLKLMYGRVEYLVEPDVPSMHGLVELRSGSRVELHCLHPKPPHPGQSKDTEERDAELLLVGRAVRGSIYPAIVAGDLNDVAWSHTTRLFQRISGLLDPRVGRGLYNTFHAEYPLLRFPLDHIFHSNHFKLVKLEKGPYFGSDHFPVYIELSFEPESKTLQEAPSPDVGDLEESREKIEEAGRPD